MKFSETKSTQVARSQKANQPFFLKERDTGFFKDRMERETGFFNPTSLHNMNDKGVVQTKPVANLLPTSINPIIQTKCAACEDEEKLIQRQEAPDSPETKPVSNDNTEAAPAIPLGKRPRVSNCRSDPKFPNFGCYGHQLKLDIDENLFNNAHQFIRVATLFPGDNQLMLDTFLRYGVGKNLLETSFGFAGVNKRWSSILSYGTGAALKSYDLLHNGKLKLDVQLPLGKGVNLDIKFDYTTKPDNPGEEKGINTVIGVSGSF